MPNSNKERDTLKNGIINEGGKWKLTNGELVNKHMYLFQKFVNSINFEDFVKAQRQKKGEKEHKRTRNFTLVRKDD